MTNEEMERYLPSHQLLPVLLSENGQRVPISDLLRIDPATMVLELRVQASWQATIGWHCMRQEITVARLERDVERMEAGLFIEHRNTLAAKGAGSRAPGVELVKSYVTIDARLVDIQDKLFDAREKLAAWKAALSAMHARRECLINMGAELRIEKKSVL